MEAGDQVKLMEPRDRYDWAKGTRKEETEAGRAQFSCCHHPARPHLSSTQRLSLLVCSPPTGLEDLKSISKPPSVVFLKKQREQFNDYSLNFALIQHSSPLWHD